MDAPPLGFTDLTVPFLVQTSTNALAVILERSVLVNVPIIVIAVTTSMVCVTLDVIQDGEEITVMKFAYTGSLDKTVLNNASKHASVVTMSMVRVFLGANKAGRGTGVVKHVTRDSTVLTAVKSVDTVRT